MKSGRKNSAIDRRQFLATTGSRLCSPAAVPAGCQGGDECQSILGAHSSSQTA